MLFQSKRNGKPVGARVLGAAGRSSVDRTIAKLNIEHFRKLLSEEKDEVKRGVIFRLLEEEEAKLAGLDRSSVPKDKNE